MSHVRDGEDVIREGREVLRLLGQVAPASPEAMRLRSESQGLEEEYLRLGERAHLGGDSLSLPQLE